MTPVEYLEIEVLQPSLSKRGNLQIKITNLLLFLYYIGAIEKITANALLHIDNDMPSKFAKKVYP